MRSARIGYPPAAPTVAPGQAVHVRLSPGERLIRLYDPVSIYPIGPKLFRTWGPLKRFDHHRGYALAGLTTAADDPDRAVYYAARSLIGAVVEIFGDSVIQPGSHRILYLTLRSALTLLDLRGNAAMRIHLSHGIGQVDPPPLTQAWSRHFYENPMTFGNVDGLIYSNAHNDDDAIMLYERARPTIARAGQNIRRLAHPDFDAELRDIHNRTGLDYIP